MFELPTTIDIDGISYPIRNGGDYRMVLDCFSALNDEELSETYRLVVSLIIFYDNMNDESDLLVFGDNIEIAVREMYKFFNCGSCERSLGNKTNYKLIDWEKDSQMVASAINNVAGREIRVDKYLHWWTFMGYYLAIGECPLSLVVGIRAKIKRGKKLEDYEKTFKRDNPQYFVWDSQSAEQKREEQQLLDMIRNGGL